MYLAYFYKNMINYKMNEVEYTLQYLFYWDTCEPSLRSKELKRKGKNVLCIA